MNAIAATTSEAASSDKRGVNALGHRKNKLRSGVTSGDGRSVKILRGPGPA